jgi:hypothetical protein
MGLWTSWVQAQAPEGRQEPQEPQEPQGGQREWQQQEPTWGQAHGLVGLEVSAEAEPGTNGSRKECEVAWAEEEVDRQSTEQGNAEPDGSWKGR